MVKTHLNVHLKKKTVQKLKVKEDNWNSYLTENKFKITDEERIEKKKLFTSKNNIIRSRSADGKRCKDQNDRDVNALDLLMMGDDDHNGARRVGEVTANERHKTFLPTSPPSSSSSKTKKNRQTSPSLSSSASTALKRRSHNEIVISQQTEIDGDDSTMRGVEQKQLHTRSSAVIMSSKSSRRVFTPIDPDPDWKHITSNIRSLYAELRYYEELSGKRSILDTRDEINDMLRDKELNDPRSSKVIMQYLLDLVCQSLTYLLKNEVELQEERSKNDLLNAQLDDYRSGRTFDLHPKSHRAASVPQVIADIQFATSNTTSNDESIPGTNLHSTSTPHTHTPASSSMRMSRDNRNGIIQLTSSKIQTLGKLSDSYVDAYASYIDSPIRREGSVDGDNLVGDKNSSGAAVSNPQHHMFPSIDFARMDALINYSKAVSVDNNECSTIDRLSSMAASGQRSEVRTNGPLDGYNSDDSMPPPPPPSQVVGSSTAPPPPVVTMEEMKGVVRERPVMQALRDTQQVAGTTPVLRMTSNQDALIPMTNLWDATSTMMQSTGPVSINQLKASKTIPSPMAMNGSSTSDWLFFDFSTPTPLYNGLPPYQSTGTTHLYPTGGISTSSMVGDDGLDRHPMPLNDRYPSYAGTNQTKNAVSTTHRLDGHYNQHSHSPSVPEYEQSSRKATTSRPVIEQISIVQPLVDVPVPQSAPTHPYSSDRPTGSSSSPSDNGINYQLPEDSGLSPIAKQLMNQYRLPFQQRTFDARNGSF